MSAAEKEAASAADLAVVRELLGMMFSLDRVAIECLPPCKPAACPECVGAQERAGRRRRGKR